MDGSREKSSFTWAQPWIGVTHAFANAAFSTFAMGRGAAMSCPVRARTDARAIWWKRSSHICMRTVTTSSSGSTGPAGSPPWLRKSS